MSIKLFSERVREARLATGISMAELAKRAGYDRHLLHRIENCKDGRNSRLQTVFDLAQALGVSPAWLIGVDVPPNTGGN